MKTAFWRSVVGFAAAAVATISTASGAQAVTLSPDVQQPVYSQSEGFQVMAQTFTADTSAQLARVSLPVSTYQGIYGLARGSVGIEGVTSTGTPNGTYLATPTSFSRGFSCCWNDFDLSPAVAMTKGTRYAIVVRVTFGTLSWYYTPVAPPAFPVAQGQLWVSCATGCTWYGGGSFGADFGFETWISAAAANQAPTVAADHSAVTVTEGTPPTDTGTFADPDGDTVTLKASTGTLATNSPAGTWSWTGAATDEGGPQSVTVTADDGHGLTSTASFTYTVATAAPTAQIVTDPPTAPEGVAVGLTGTATSPDAADNAAGFGLAWTVTKDGGQFAQGSGASFSFTPDDEGTYVVTLHATDDGAMTGTTSLTIVGTNVAPTAAIGGVTASAPLVTTSFESLTFTGSFSDPGVLDTHTVSWDFGDGTTATAGYGPGGSAGFSTSHAYAAAGTYTVQLTVTDDDGGTVQATTTVDVQTAQAALASIESYVRGLSGLTNGERQSLIAKLDAASAATTRGDTTAANNELNAFLNEVNADVATGRLTQAQASELRAAVHAVQGALGTYNRFLDWWPLAA